MTQEEINDLMWKSMADWQKDQLIDGGNIDAAKRRIRELESENKQLQNTSSNSDYAKLKGAIESIADYGGCLTGEDAQEMKQIAIKALQ